MSPVETTPADPTGVASPSRSTEAIHVSPSPAKSSGAATLLQSRIGCIGPNVPSPASSNQRGSQSSTDDSAMICRLRSRARSSSRPNSLGCTNGSRVSKLVEITSRATSSTERVASTEPSRCERRSSVAFAGSDTSYSDTIVSAAPSQLVVTTSNRSPSSSSWWLPFGSSGWPTTSVSATRTMRNPSLLATYTNSPSVSTMSPSSTPTSWVFVPENVSAAGASTGAGATVACALRSPSAVGAAASAAVAVITSPPIGTIPPPRPHAVTRSDASVCM